MTFFDLHRLLESIQCIICPDCTTFKTMTNSQVVLFICGKCRRFITTCAGDAIGHACSVHPELRFSDAVELAHHFDFVFLVHSFEILYEYHA